MNRKNLWKPIALLALILLSFLYVLPTLLPEGKTPSWYPFQKRLAFGLDLQGGLELRYTVDYQRAIADNLLRTREAVTEQVVEALARRTGRTPRGFPRRTARPSGTASPASGPTSTPCC